MFNAVDALLAVLIVAMVIGVFTINYFMVKDEDDKSHKAEH